MSGEVLLGASRKRAASTDLEAAVASAMEAAGVSLASQGDADALVALETDVEAADEPSAAAQELADASLLDKHAPELTRWLDECRAANGGDATHDDVFFFFETTYPEVLDRLPELFHWITLFMEHAAPSAIFLPAPDTQDLGAAYSARPIPDWVPDAVARLEATGDLATVATESGLKSPVTLLYWKNEHAKRELQREHDSHRALRDAAELHVGESEAGPVADVLENAAGDSIADVGRHRTAFMREDELSEWVLGHQFDQLTRQDVMSHVAEAYPVFAATKSPAALKVWTARFLKRYMASTPAGYMGSKSKSKSPSSAPSRGLKRSSVGCSENSEGAVTSGSGEDKAMTGEHVQDKGMFEADASQTNMAPESSATTEVSTTATDEVDGTEEKPRAAPRKRRGACTSGYVLHSNEFKLNALRKLDEGKSISEVAQELGLKSQNSLTYWSSIRDKLVTSEKKRFRLAGGGRRSSCTFEGELLMWVSERHQKGLGTDVRAVLDYMREFHSSFTEGKKEPTLRKWILRFFKRCWRAPSATSEPQDTSKSYIFV